MTSPIKRIAVIASFLMAGLLHLYYIDYKTDLDGHLFRIAELNKSASDEVRANLKKQLLQRTAKDRMLDYDPVTWNRLQKERSDIEDSIRIHRAVLRAWLKSNEDENLLARERDIIEELYQEIDELDGELENHVRNVTRKELDRISATRVPLGLFPSANIGDSTRLSRREAFWLGLVLPTVLLAGAAMLLTLKRTNKLTPAQNVAQEDRNEDIRDGSGSAERPKAVHLAEAVRDHLGEDFPAPSGNGSRSNPLVISATENYVKYEYEAARVAMMLLRLDYKSEGNRLHSPQDGRHIDELVFAVKPLGAAEWTGKQSLFFDVTAGFQSLK